MSFKGPTEETWQRQYEHDPAGNFNFALGRNGPYKFWQHGNGNEWSEAEMDEVDALMLRICDVDRMHWTFTTYKDGAHTCQYSADPPNARMPFYQSQTFGEFLAKVEMSFISISLRSYRKGEPETCKWCTVRTWDDDYPEGLVQWQLLRHVEAEHPEEIATVRAERLERLEYLRDYYRRRDERWHAEIDGPHKSRTFIL